MNIKETNDAYRRFHNIDDIDVGSYVLFNGVLDGKLHCTKGMVVKANKTNIKIKGPLSYKDWAENDDIKDIKVPEYVVKPESVFPLINMEENMETKIILCNRFASEKIGDTNVTFTPNLEKYLFRVIEPEDIKEVENVTLIQLDGSLIPATACIKVIKSLYETCDIGLNSDFNITDNKEDIIYPLVRKPGVKVDDIKQCISYNNNIRIKSKENEIKEYSDKITNLTKELTNLSIKYNNIGDEIKLIEKATRGKIDDELVDVAYKTINHRWNDFHYMSLPDGGFKLIFEGDISLEYNSNSVNIGYLIVEVSYDNDGNCSTIVKNIANSQDGYPHPYVRDDNTPCFASETANYIKILASGDLTRISEFLYQFLTFTRGTTEHPISSWSGDEDDDE